MIRLKVLVEGRTEEVFFRDVLSVHLQRSHVFGTAWQVATSSKAGKAFKGGSVRYAKIRRELVRSMKQDKSSDVRFSTMFDLYRLPKDFPGVDVAGRMTNPYERINRLEAAWEEDIDDSRFIPYLQLHEFEALLLAEPERLKNLFPFRADAVEALCVFCRPPRNPEEIDDKELTSPSKRIIACVPEYQNLKASAGPQTAQAIGIEKLRARCSHFSEWLARLETLKTETRGNE